jgi:hypothetical protein
VAERTIDHRAKLGVACRLRSFEPRKDNTQYEMANSDASQRTAARDNISGVAEGSFVESQGQILAQLFYRRNDRVLGDRCVQLSYIAA